MIKVNIKDDVIGVCNNKLNIGLYSHIELEGSSVIIEEEIYKLFEMLDNKTPELFDRALGKFITDKIKELEGEDEE